MNYCVAVDGPAGAGKSTIARKVAKQLELVYVDTGAMYRAMALFMLRQQVTAEEIEKINEKCEEAAITLKYENGEQIVCLNGENVNAWLRTEEVGNMASVVATQKKVRERIVQEQKNLAKVTDVIMDGRDIGTCVLPDADVKIYLTADSAVRAKRRYEELAQKGISADVNEIEKDIIERDHRDMTREESPLKQAPDAILVDSSYMTIDEVVAAIVKICEEKRGK